MRRSASGSACLRLRSTSIQATTSENAPGSGARGQGIPIEGESGVAAGSPRRSPSVTTRSLTAAGIHGRPIDFGHEQKERYTASGE